MTNARPRDGLGHGPTPLEMVFIPAPRITRVGASVSVLARHEGAPVLVRQGNLVAATFHPEMGEDRTLHRLLARLVAHAVATA